MIHRSILDDARRNIIPCLGFLGPLHFYLAGGTALALHYGHRTSVDFDFYTATDLRDVLPLLADLQQHVIAQQHGVQTIITWAQQKFPQLDPYVMLRALIYFIDAENDTSMRGKTLRQPIAWETIKTFFSAEVRQLEKILL